MEIKTEDKTNNKQIFKDLIGKLNQISDKAEEAEVVLTEFCKNKGVAPQLSTSPVSTLKTKLTESTDKHRDMRDILSRFNTLFEENIAPVLTESTSLSEFDLAVKTKATPAGVQIGKWEIKKLIEGKEITYDIVDTSTQITILEDIRTYVAATAVVKLLNAGKAANSKSVSEFLNLDESFRINYQDAIRYKRKFLKTGQPVFEDRYEVCKGKALQLKESIKNKSANLEIL